jgi:hypothetical protein
MDIFPVYGSNKGFVMMSCVKISPPCSNSCISFALAAMLSKVSTRETKSPAAFEMFAATLSNISKKSIDFGKNLIFVQLPRWSLGYKKNESKVNKREF